MGVYYLKMSKAPTTEVDEKLKQYKEKQIEIQSLFSQKQKVLSQFNENTLVKGVSKHPPQKKH